MDKWSMFENNLPIKDIKSKSNISIAIPTFNQSIFLNLFFMKHILLLKKLNIQVVVSDNASPDDTELVVKKWQKEFPLISYYCNEKNVGYDKNVLAALGYSKTKYTWLMGDTYYISLELFQAVLLEVDKHEDLDFIVINLENMIKNIPSNAYTDQNKILSDLGGVMTCLSCLVFHKNIINSNLGNLNHLSAFIHLEMILNYISDNNFKSSWIADYSVKSLKHPTMKKVNWSHKQDVLEIGFKKWVDFIFSLPNSYLMEDKINCIRSFGKLSKLGTFRGFLLMRMRGHLTSSSYKKYSSEIDLMRTIPSFFVRLIIIVPSSILKFFFFFINKIFNLKL
jgi:abequosyltransferase